MRKRKKRQRKEKNGGRRDLYFFFLLGAQGEGLGVGVQKGTGQVGLLRPLQAGRRAGGSILLLRLLELVTLAAFLTVCAEWRR